jgi:hypothetical protein
VPEELAVVTEATVVVVVAAAAAAATVLEGASEDAQGQRWHLARRSAE